MRAPTVSTLSRPVNSEANDQRTPASSAVSQAPCVSRSTTLAMCMSVGTTPVMPVTSSEGEEIAQASSRLPGAVCRPANDDTAATAMPIAVQPRIRRTRIRTPARG